MPRYDYECQSCMHRFEVRQSFSSDSVATCPVCQNGARRVIHSVPVMFKGSGFYVNDYGKKGASSTSSAGKDGSDGDLSRPDKSASPDSSSKDGTKAEKPAKGESPSSKASREKAGTKSGD